MKQAKGFIRMAILTVAVAGFVFQPIVAAAFNPQPEPPGKQAASSSNPGGGETKMGIAIEDKKLDYSQQGGANPGATKMGLEPSPFKPDTAKQKTVQ